MGRAVSLRWTRPLGNVLVLRIWRHFGTFFFSSSLALDHVHHKRVVVTGVSLVAGVCDATVLMNFFLAAMKTLSC